MDPTELRDPLTVGIDLLPTAELITRLIARHVDVPQIVAQHAGALAGATDGAVERLRGGGRLVYTGSGTSARLAAADASELRPTYGWPDERLAVITPGTGLEDSREHGHQAGRQAGLQTGDVVLSVSASGRTAFTLGVTEAAWGRDALTIAMVCNRRTPIAALSNHEIELVVGPEPIAGSTRMRAGLAQKLALTVLSTGVMVRLGRTYDNLMVEVAPTLEKLRARQEGIITQACEIPPPEARRLLQESDGDLEVAITMGLATATVGEARAALRSGGGVRRAVRDLTGRADRP